MTWFHRRLGFVLAFCTAVVACSTESDDEGDAAADSGSGTASSGGRLDAPSDGGSPGQSGGADGNGGSNVDAAGGRLSSSGGATGGVSAVVGGSGGVGAGGSDSGGGQAVGGGSATGGSGPGPAGSTLTIDGPGLLLDGVPFHIRGVNWNPVPPGANHPDGLDYAGFADQDIALMRAAGINAIRTYERLEDTDVLDKFYQAGIYVMSTVYGWHGDDPGVVTARVNAAKDHPAILAWVIGNEWNYNQLYANDGNTAGARDKLNQVAALIKATDPERPVASIWGGTSGLAETVALMPDVDIWGINFYGGLSLDDVFENWPNAGSGPMFFGEYGADAYNDTTDSVDTAAQAEATRVLTQAIVDHYVTDSGGVTVGGFIFEWSDEWWKDSGGSLDVQDVGGIAPGGGPHPDQTFNEEFWGIVDIDRNPRPAYDALKAIYAP